MRRANILLAVLLCGLWAGCRNKATPPPTAAPAPVAPATAVKPEIASVRLALAIDPQTKKLRGTGNIFKLAHLQQNKRLHVAILLKALQGGETLTLTLIDPSGKESEPIVKQYAADDRGDYFETAFFDATHWRTGVHQIKVNLSDIGFAISEFAVVP